MKKLFFTLVFAVLCISLFAGGTIISSRAITGEVETTDGVRYNYLPISEGSKLTANTDSVFITDADNYLLKIDRTSGETELISPAPLESAPLHIQAAGNRLLVFSENKMYVYLINSLTKSTEVTLSNQAEVFHVIQNTNGTYRIYTAYNSEVRYFNYNPSSNTVSSQTLFKSLPGQQVTGITSENGNIFLLATIPGSQSEPYGNRIYNSEEDPICSEYFVNASGITGLGNGKFALLTDKGLTLFDAATDTSTLVGLSSSLTIELESSRHPICIAALSAGEIFVLDLVKRSIDLYELSGTSLRFKSIIAAHCGDDNGYYFNPRAVCVIEQTSSDSARYLIADSTAVKMVDMSKPAGSQTTTLINDASVTALAYDYYKHIYTYDIMNHQIKKYELTANSARLIHTFDYNFGRITQLAAAPDQSVYALDRQNGKIIKLTGTTAAALTIPGVTITGTTRAAISETTMYLINPNKTVSLSNLTSENAAYTAGGSQLTDIATDALGNPVVFSKTTEQPATYYLNSEIVSDAGASASQLSLSIDRLNKKAYWIGENHSVRSAELPGLWSPKGKETYDWDKKDPVEKLTVEDAQTLFIKTTAPAVLYTYPNAISSVTMIPANTVSKVLKYETVIDGNAFGYAYVMYETAGNPKIGYISHSLTTTQNVDYYTEELGFRPENLYNSGRVVQNGVYIFKYPTCFDFHLTVGSVPKNFNLTQGSNMQGLILNRLITISDSLGLEFYEIKLNADGRPDRNGTYVGYIRKGQVIDSTEPPSNPKFSSNAHIVLSLNTPQLQVYQDEQGLYPFENDFLINNQKVRVSFPLDKSKPYTAVTYIDESIGIEFTGYVATANIVRNGISAFQIFGILLLTAALTAVIVLLILLVRLKRKKA